MSLLQRTKDWWISRARREPDTAMGAGARCLCEALSRIEDGPGKFVDHDPRCALAKGKAD